MRIMLMLLFVLILAIFCFAQGKGDPRLPAQDPAVGIIVPVGIEQAWVSMLIPYKTRAYNFSVGLAYEGNELLNADITECMMPPWDLAKQITSDLPKGRLYATVTTITQDWQVIKRHYILDSR